MVTSGAIGAEPGKLACDQRRAQLGAFAGEEFELLPHRVRHDQDIGKQDRPVEPEPADRLQGHLARRLAIVNQIEEPALVGPQGAVFGQISPCLAHEPDGWAFGAFAAQAIEKRTGHAPNYPK